jgi:hypothetical protein
MRTSTKTRTNLALIGQDLTATISISQARAAAPHNRERGRAEIRPIRTKLVPAPATWTRGTTVKGNPSTPARRGIPEISYQRTSQTMF